MEQIILEEVINLKSKKQTPKIIKRKIKVYYFYPMNNIDNNSKLVELDNLLNHLKSMPVDKRILGDVNDEHIQLKFIKYNQDEKRWYLAFLKNGIDAPFKTKLDDEVDTAEALDDNEFVGQECCVIYDEQSKVISMQNNRGSISYQSLASFFNKYLKVPIILSPITYKNRYCEISDEEFINYKSIVLSFTDISKLNTLSEKQDTEAIDLITKLANNLSACNGKIELSVGRTEKRLDKKKLKNLVNFLKRNKEVVSTLKVKMLDEDTIKLIDLINNKVESNIEVAISKEDPKTFTKIFEAMNNNFDLTIADVFRNCNMFINE